MSLGILLFPPTPSTSISDRYYYAQLFFVGAEDLTPDACMAGISPTEPRPQSTLGHTLVASASWDTGT